MNMNDLKLELQEQRSPIYLYVYIYILYTYVTPKNIESTSNSQIDLHVRETGRTTQGGGETTLSETVVMTFVCRGRKEYKSGNTRIGIGIDLPLSQLFHTIKIF
jgi:hypothetical protein